MSSVSFSSSESDSSYEVTCGLGGTIVTFGWVLTLLFTLSKLRRCLRLFDLLRLRLLSFFLPINVPRVPLLSVVMILGIRLSSLDLVLRLEGVVELSTVLWVGVVGDVMGLTDADCDLFRCWALLMMLGRGDEAASDELRSRTSELLDFTSFWKKLGAIHDGFYLIVVIAVLHSGLGVASFRYARYWTKQTNDL
jgi:hypothetical protein